MADTYVAKANVVKVSIGSPGGNRIAHFVRAGGVIPEGVEPDALTALAKRGLITKVKAAPVISAAAKAKADAEAKAKADTEAKEKAEAAEAAKAAAAKEAAEKTATK